MRFVSAIGLLLVGTLSVSAQAPAPKGVPAAPARKPAAPEPPPPPRQTPAEIATWQARVNELRQARATLKDEHTTTSSEFSEDGAAHSERMAALRLKLSNLLQQVDGTGPRGADVPSPSPRLSIDPAVEPRRSSEPAALEPDAATDPVGFGNSLFGLGEYEQALKAYQQAEQVARKPQDRLPVQYLMACCLRKLGKVDEAVEQYRKIAETKADEPLRECAQWQLDNIKWRKEVEAQLKGLQQRRRALETLP
jgi:tetratricopeptide (TPR) repeat protein